VGRRGPKAKAGRCGKKKEKGEGKGWAAGKEGRVGPAEGRAWPRVGWAGGLGLFSFFSSFFSFSFSIPLQIFFKPFQIFYIFSNSNFNTNFSNYFKGFSQTLLTTFQTYFKLKPSFF
jgi:hypothetical protein